MKEIQEVDIDGAPLLFHAASSRGEHSCFRTARDLITTVLGKGELMEQVEAVDALDRGILIHAARSNHVDTLKEVLSMARRAARSMVVDHCMRRTILVESLSRARPLVLAEMMSKRDRMGMNCLHHAAEAGCCEVLSEVMKECRGEQGVLNEEMCKADKLGRTPIMLVLTNAYRGREQHNELKEKFSTLYEAMPDEPTPGPGSGSKKKGWMTSSTEVSSHHREFRKREDTETHAVTELLHATRGGIASLELALNNCFPPSKKPVTGGFEVDFNKVLDVKERETVGESKSNGSFALSVDTETWGRALLLAAAAGLGDVDLLYHVLSAIQVSV